MATFSVAAASFGFFGYFDLLTNGARRYWQGNDSCWSGYITGSDATMQAGGDGPNPFKISVDNGAFSAPDIIGDHVVLFAGLSDAAHKVVIVEDPGYAPTFGYTPASGTMFTVNGAAPALSNGPDMGPKVNVLAMSDGIANFSSGAYGHANADPAGIGRTHVGIDTYLATGAACFHATCSDLWVYTNNDLGWYSIDGAAPVQVTLDVTQWGWKKLVTGLSGSHLFVVWTNSSLSEVATFGLMIAGSFDEIDTPKRVTQFGDSITQGGVVDGAPPGDVDLHKTAAALGFASLTVGLAGQDAAGLDSDMATILAAIEVPDIAVIAVGRNDSAGSGFRASYASIVDALKAAGVPLILCRGVTPHAETATAVNSDIETVVVGLADPDVVFIDTSTWTGIDTVDDIHPTHDGYVTLADFTTEAYEPYFGDDLPPETPTVADARTLAYRVNAGQIQARVRVVSVR